MPPKSSRKSKKLSKIENNNELRLSLMQRSIPPPLVPLTDMSPPPFEIQDLPPRSFAPVADTTTASTAASTTTSNASTATSVACSICCKDLDLNVSGTSASKKRRGPVISAKTQQMVKVGRKIIVEYSDEHRGLANEVIHSLISHDIGSCVRNRVPMLTETYAELLKDHRQIDATRGTTVSGLGRSIRKSPKERGGAGVSASKSILAEKVKSQEEQLQAVDEGIQAVNEGIHAMNERICQLEGQYANIHKIVRQLKETCEAATGSNTSQR